MRSLAVYTLWGVLLIVSCAQVDNYLRFEISEVERYYTKAQAAEAAQEWETAFAYYKHAHDSAKEKRDIIRFDDPKRDNYPYTVSLLYKAMDRVGANILKPGDWQSPMRKRIDVQQKEMLGRLNFTREAFSEARKLVDNNEYLKAMELTDQIIGAYPDSGEARNARQLKKEYQRQLQKHRKQLFDIAMLYYQEENYEMAKQNFSQLFSTYPDSPEAAETRNKIEYYIQQIEKTTKLSAKKISVVN